MAVTERSTPEADEELQHDIRELNELLVDAIEFAHAARERQIAARSVMDRIIARHRMSLQRMAEVIGISVDAVESLLEDDPMSLSDRLHLDQESIDALLGAVAKRRQWGSPLHGSHDERLHLDSVILRTLLTRSPVGFAVLDPDLRFVMVNEALAEINGLPADEHVGRTLAEVVPDIAEEATQAFQRVLGTGEPLLNLELAGSVGPEPTDVKTWYESVYRITDNRGVLGLAVMVFEVGGPP